MSESTSKTLVLITGLFTALVHLVLLSVLVVRGGGRPGPLFIANGIGYLVLLAAFWFEPAFLKERRSLVHYAFIAYTVVTILAWIPGGSRDIVGYLTKLDEIVLVFALWSHLRAERAMEV